MTLKINDYRMMEDHLVRISDVLSNGRYAVEFIKIAVEKEVEAVSAGWAFAASGADLTAITDPMLIAASHAFEANRKYEELDREVGTAWQSVLKWKSALQCFHEAGQNEVAA